jgi:hypothetical protein
MNYMNSKTSRAPGVQIQVKAVRPSVEALWSALNNRQTCIDCVPKIRFVFSVLVPHQCYASGWLIGGVAAGIASMGHHVNQALPSFVINHECPNRSGATSSNRS